MNAYVFWPVDVFEVDGGFALNHLFLELFFFGCAVLNNET
jgi:hypothetical protein